MSKRGPKFIENGKSYSFEKHSKDGRVQFWKWYVRGSCKAPLHIRDGIVVRRINQHSHPGDASKMEVLKSMSVLRHRAINTMEQTAQILAASVENLSQAGQGAMPSISNLKRTAKGSDLQIPLHLQISSYRSGTQTTRGYLVNRRTFYFTTMVLKLEQHVS